MATPGLPHDMQVRFGSAPDRLAYLPEVLATGGSSAPAIGASAVTSQGFANVLVCAQSATGEDCAHKYSLGIQAHGGAQDVPGGTDLSRNVARLAFRVNVRAGGTLAAGASHVIMSARSGSDATSYARVCVYNDAGTERLALEDVVGGVLVPASRAFTRGTFYRLELYYSVPLGTLQLWSQAQGESSWTLECSRTTSTTLAAIGVLRLGSVGTSSSSTGAWTVELHSFRAQFEEFRRSTGLNGTSSRLTIASTAALQTGATDFALAGWFYLTAYQFSTIVGKLDAAGVLEYRVRYNNTLSRLQFDVSADGVTFQSVTANTHGQPTLDTWHFLLAWRDAAAGTLNVRIDGGATDSAAFTGTPFSGTTEFSFGAQKNGSGRNGYTAGRLGPWGWFKLAEGQMAAQVAGIQAALYNAGNAAYYSDLSASFKTASGMVSFWNMDEQGNVASRYDQHGAVDLPPLATSAQQGPRNIFTPSQATIRTEVEDFVACRIADVSPTGASPLLYIPSGKWRAVTHARIAYQAGSSLSSPTFGAWTSVAAATSATAYALQLPALTGLTAGTGYVYRWELSRDGTNVHVQSDVRTFRTRTAVGASTSTQTRRLAWSCSSSTPTVLPNREVGAMLDGMAAAGEVLEDSFCLGDMFYEGVALNASGSAGAETVDQFVTQALETLYDPHVNRLVKLAAFLWLPSDHEVVNNGDSRMRTNSTVRSTLVTAAAAAGYADPKCTYSAGVTLGNLWDAAAPLIENWCWKPWLTTDIAGTGYDLSGGNPNSFMKHGRVYELRLDLRWTGRDASGYLSAGQETAIHDAAAALNADADADLLLIVCESPVTRVNGSAADSWAVNVLGENRAVMQDLHDTVTAPGKGILFMVGDKHAIFWADSYFQGSGGVVLTDPADPDASALKAQVGCSPVGANMWVGDPDKGYWDAGIAPHVLTYYDPREKYGMATQNPAGEHAVQSSGVLFTLHQGQGTFAMRVVTDYGVTYEPLLAGLTAFPVMAPIAGSSPPVLLSLTPADGSVISEGVQLVVEAVATDADADIASFALASDVDGTISGGEAITGLPAGQVGRRWRFTPASGTNATPQAHTYTVTVTDAAALTDTDDVQITVGVQPGGGVGGGFLSGAVGRNR